MVNDLKNWILIRKAGNGSFEYHAEGFDHIGKAPPNITDAYIVWSLTSSGITDLDAEIQNLIQ